MRVVVLSCVFCLVFGVVLVVVPRVRCSVARSLDRLLREGRPQNIGWELTARVLAERLRGSGGGSDGPTGVSLCKSGAGEEVNGEV